MFLPFRINSFIMRNDIDIFQKRLENFQCEIIKNIKTKWLYILLGSLCLPKIAYKTMKDMQASNQYRARNNYVCLYTLPKPHFTLSHIHPFIVLWVIFGKE